GIVVFRHEDITIAGLMEPFIGHRQHVRIEVDQDTGGKRQIDARPPDRFEQRRIGSSYSGYRRQPFESLAVYFDGLERCVWKQGLEGQNIKADVGAKLSNRPDVAASLDNSGKHRGFGGQNFLTLIPFDVVVAKLSGPEFLLCCDL